MGSGFLFRESAVVILQELVQLFHIGNFLSVEEGDFDGIGFLISRRCGNNPSGTQPVFSYQNSLSVWSEWRKWNIRNSQRKSDNTSAASQWVRSKCSVSWIKTSYFLCFMWFLFWNFCIPFWWSYHSTTLIKNKIHIALCLSYLFDIINRRRWGRWNCGSCVTFWL